MIPIIKTRILPSIGEMHKIAMRYIFEKQGVLSFEMRLLEEGIEWWTKKVDLTASERWELKRIVNALIADEKGFFYRAKILIAQHNIDYRKMYKSGLPFVDVDNRTSFSKR